MVPPSARIPLIVAGVAVIAAIVGIVLAVDAKNASTSDAENQEQVREELERQLGTASGTLKKSEAALEARLDTLEKQVKGMRNRGFQAQIDALRNRVNDLATDVSNQGNTLQSLQNLPKQIERIDQRLDRIAANQN